MVLNTQPRSQRRTAVDFVQEGGVPLPCATCCADTIHRKLSAAQESALKLGHGRDTFGGILYCYWYCDTAGTFVSGCAESRKAVTDCYLECHPVNLSSIRTYWHMCRELIGENTEQYKFSFLGFCLDIGCSTTPRCLLHSCLNFRWFGVNPTMV